MKLDSYKRYDKKYRHLAGTALKAITKEKGRIAREDIDESDHFPYADLKFSPIKPFLTQVEVQTAVYGVPSSEEWQKFRVSLKGLTTKEKLYCLMWRWIHHSHYQEPMEKYHELVRIQNYLGALVRGGQLSDDWRIVH